ncbi:MFS transporter [Pseudaquabacterium pictum]|uniref:MFS transporter n=1 Tax=Pseudaquabacterium pictum TaxID=2315236 RepID=A0A480ANY9_9BURK|nr:MFS transporter [Rubrivivax pictus]GCL61782.1 MFS transporter [Rubrivivax pictus]
MPTDSAHAHAPGDGLPTPARHWAMATVLLGIGLSVLDATMVTLALPGIVRDLRISESDGVWLLNAYQLAVLVLLLPLAMVGDLFGYRRVYLAGVALFALASLASVLATSATQLALARALLGAGAAGVFAVNAALVRLIYPARLLGRGIAINSAVVAVASVAGPAVAAGILSLASWHWLFALNVPIALGLLLLAWRSLPPNRSPAPVGTRIPWLDGLLNAAMFLLLFLGVQRLVPHGQLPAAPTLAAGLIAAGVVVGVVYVRRQRRQAVPLLPVDLLAIPVFRLSMCTSVAAFGAQTLAAVALPFLLLDGLQRSAGQVGWLLAAWPAGTVLSAPLAGRLIGRVPSGLLGGIGLGLLALGLAGLALLPAHPSGLALAGWLGVCGIGFGLFQSPNNHTIVTSAPAHRSGGAAGMLGTARLTGQSIGALVIGLLYGLQAGHPGQVPVLALGVAAALAAVGGVTSLLRVRVQTARP